jgi:hypothetical protein
MTAQPEPTPVSRGTTNAIPARVASCGTHAKLAVVDPHTDLVDDYLAPSTFPDMWPPA